MKCLFPTLAIGLVTLNSALGAPAVTLGGSPLANEGIVSSVSGATTVNFNGLNNGGPQSLVSGIASYSNVFGLLSAVDILNDTTRAVTPGTAADLTVSFSQPINYFGLYWGSPDPLNTITFFSGANAVLSYTGQMLHDQLGVSFGTSTSVYVNFTAGAGESFTNISISRAGSFQFEQDNHAFRAASVPDTGPTVAMFLAVMLGIGAIRRRLAISAARSSPR